MGPTGQHLASLAPRLLSRFVWLHGRDAGWREPGVRPGDAITAGRQLVTISTLDGAQVLETVNAPTAGIVRFLTTSPSVTADGLLMGVGAE
jgi:uncharacterized protein